MTTLIDFVNPGDIVTIPDLSISEMPVAAYGSSESIGSWINVDRGESYPDERFALVVVEDLEKAYVSKFLSIPRNVHFITWTAINGDNYNTQFAAAYGHLGNKVWEFQGRRMMADDLMKHIREVNTSGIIRPMIVHPAVENHI